jgi:hypothetical protein
VVQSGDQVGRAVDKGAVEIKNDDGRVDDLGLLERAANRVVGIRESARFL